MSEAFKVLVILEEFYVVPPVVYYQVYYGLDLTLTAVAVNVPVQELSVNAFVMVALPIVGHAPNVNAISVFLSLAALNPSVAFPSTVTLIL